MEASAENQERLIDLTAQRSRLIDELRRVERALDARTKELERSTARFRDVIERNADAIVVVDHEGIIRFANAMATRLFGAARDALLNTPFGFPLVTGDTTEIDLRSQGEPRTAELRVVQSEWEGATAYIASLRDVTERRRAELNERRLIREQAARTAAEESARKLRFLLESSTALAGSLDYDTTLSVLARICVPELADWAIVYCVDDDGSVQRLEVTHRDPERAAAVREMEASTIEAKDHPVLAAIRSRTPLLVESGSAQWLDAMAENARQRELFAEFGFESLIVVPLATHDRALGAVALVSSRPSRRFDADDLALAEDIARRAALAMVSARLYEETRRANEGKADFLAIVSHDLRTPLTAIIGYAELLEMGVPEPLPVAAQQPVQRIRTSARHLLYLLKELLSFARLDAGREEVRLQDVDLRDIGREIGAVMEPLAAEHRLRLQLSMPNDAVFARTDPDKIRQVLLNLVGNAVKYTEHGEVHLEISPPEGGEVCVRVRDTGVGIAEEHLAHIFEPFWQVDPTRRSRDGGTGLGLSVVQRLMRLVSGKVRVESVLGEGTTFTVTLPAAVRRDDAPAVPSPSPAS